MAGLFGGMAPVFGSDTPLTTTASQPDLGPVPQVSAPKKRGLFGSGIQWQQIAGSLGDALMVANGGQMQYAPMMAEMRQREWQIKQRQAQQQADRQNDWTDWQRKQEYEAAHPKAINNDTINDFNWFKGLSPEDRATYSQMHPQYQTVHNPDGTVTVYPMGGMAPSAPAPSAPSVIGKDLPPGWTVQGGTGGNVGGGFR